MIVRENVALAPLTTIKVGGSARYFIEASTAAEVVEAIGFSRQKAMRLFVLGGGSNLVVSDKGWPGVVLKIAIPGIEDKRRNGKIIFEVGAGESWDKFVATAVERNGAGVECLSGIPGSVGGTPVQNVGAYGQEVSQTIHSVSAIDVESRKLRELNNQECGFNYRTSIFNTSQKNKFVIVKVLFQLIEGGESSLQYADLKKYFAGWSETPALADVREAVRTIRASKGMLITEGDDDCRSAGSFFKNPVISPEHFEDLVKRAAAAHLQIPSYPALDSQRKVSAAWLVEHSGFSKGFTNGNVGISHKHSLAIVNWGVASADEIVSLKDHMQGRVEEVWGVLLEPEPVFIGF